MTGSPSLIPIKDVYEISKELFGYGYDVIGFLFPEVPSIITARRAENLITVMRSAQKKLDDAGLKPEERNAIALKLGLPIIEKASLEEDPSLQELWANLLANALNPNHSDKVRSIFIDIIQNLSPLDVLILNAFHASPSPLIRNPNYLVDVYTKDGYKSYHYEKVDTSITVLEGLNLITDIVPLNQHLFSLLQQQVDYTLTVLGKLFVDACVVDHSDRSTETAD